MKTHQAKRVAIIIEQVMQSRLKILVINLKGFSHEWKA